MRSYLFAAVAVVILWSVCTAAWCQEIGESPYSANVVGVATNSPVSNIWTYTIYNTSSSADYALWQVGIELDAGTRVKSIITPDGWGVDKADPSYICLFTTVTDLAAGKSQGGFVVEFNQAPQEQNWSVAFTNGIEMPYYFGTVTPASVPEPGSIITLSLGLSSMVALARRRRS